MAKTRVTSLDSATVGADGGFLTDANAATFAALGVGAVTAGGAAFVAAAVVPGQVAAGITATTVLAVGAETKKRTGFYLPFLHGKEDDKKQAPAAEAAA